MGFYRAEVAEKNVYCIYSAFFASSAVKVNLFFTVEIIGFLTFDDDPVGG